MTCGAHRLSDSVPVSIFLRPANQKHLRSITDRMEIADLSITAFIPAVYLEGGRLSKPVGALPPYCAFLALAGPLFVVAFEKCRKGICKSQTS